MKGNEAHHMHWAIRIALYFTCLIIGAFTKVMASPGDIEDMLEQLVE